MTILKIILVTALLLLMVLVLVLIGFLANPSGSDTGEGRDRLRHDVETRDRVITSSSIFHQFFARPNAEPGNNINYNYSEYPFLRRSMSTSPQYN